MHPADTIVALLCPQEVRPLILSQECTLLTPRDPAPPSVCTSSRPLTEIHPADPLTVLLYSQLVCPVIHSLTCTLLTLLWPCSTLSVYVLSFQGNAPC